MSKRVSVIVPVYNGASTIRECIDSALAQEYEPKEVIVVDDGSTDSTPSILRSYGTQIKIIHQENRGLSAARNVGVAASDGEYLALLDGDDVWLPGKLAKTCAALDNNPDAALVFSGFVRMDERGKTETVGDQRPPTMNDLLSHKACIILPSSVVMRRRVYALCGGFSERFRGANGFEDHFFWLLARELADFVCVADPLVIYRDYYPLHKIDKYEPNRRIFEELVRHRYGKAANGLIRGIRRDYAASFVARSLAAIGDGDYRAALNSGLKAMRLTPFYLFLPRSFIA